MQDKTAAQRRADFEALYERRFAEVTRYVRRRVEPAAAEDAVSEVFLVAWRRLSEIPAAPAERAWLLATARKILANSYRSRQRREALVERLITDHATVPLSDPAEAVLDRLRVRGVLDSLSTTDQEMLRLAEWEQLAPGEIATVLGCSTAAAKVRLHRSRKRFAHALAAAAPVATHSDTIEVHP